MTLIATFDAYQFNRYDHGETINFKLYKYQGDGIDTWNQFDATTNSYNTVVIKSFKRHGDRAFFFRDVAKALTVIGQVAQLINDVPGTWTTQNIGEGSYAWTLTARPTVPGYLWLMVQVSNASGSQESSQLVRVFVNPSEAQ